MEGVCFPLVFDQLAVVATLTARVIQHDIGSIPAVHMTGSRHLLSHVERVISPPMQVIQIGGQLYTYSTATHNPLVGTSEMPPVTRNIFDFP